MPEAEVVEVEVVELPVHFFLCTNGMRFFCPALSELSTPSRSETYGLVGSLGGLEEVVLKPDNLRTKFLALKPFELGVGGADGVAGVEAVTRPPDDGGELDNAAVVMLEARELGIALGVTTCSSAVGVEGDTALRSKAPAAPAPAVAGSAAAVLVSPG